jgi:hypothetical protein
MAAFIALAGCSVNAQPQDVFPGLFNAVGLVESGGTEWAVGPHGERGIVQISPIVIKDVNRIYGTRFTNSDAFSIDKSRQIFNLYTNHYVKRYPDTPANRAAIWHYGPTGPSMANGSDYVGRVCALLISSRP